MTQQLPQFERHDSEFRVGAGGLVLDLRLHRLFDQGIGETQALQRQVLLDHEGKPVSLVQGQLDHLLSGAQMG